MPSPRGPRYWERSLERISRRDLSRLQKKRLRFILKYVYDRSPFYKRAFKQAKVHPSDFIELDDIRRFPFTTKDDLRQYSYPHGGDFLCVPRKQLIGWHMTSGTTGRPTVGPYTMKDHETWMNVMARTLVTAGVRPGDTLLNIYGYGLFTGGLGFHQSCRLVGAAVIPWSVGRTEPMVQAIQDFKPTVMTGTPSYQLYVLETLRKNGVDPTSTSLRLTIPGAEVWTEEMRQRIEKGYGLKAKGGGARNVYGATELLGPGSGQECEQENGFHFWTDHFYLEILDPETGEPVEAGEQGEMVVTTMTKEAMPLIRYRMRDLTILDDSGCACGRNAFPRCMWVTGRVDDVIHYRGTKIWPGAIQQAMFKFPEVNDYLIEVDRTGSKGFRISVELKAGSEASGLRERIEKEMGRTLIFISPKISFVSEGALPRYEGKSKRVILE
ncbi:MAG TPA: phenylacetate--CoA ligase [Nitrososphaerales archaeon]|nr:phenylacetate--CoA ligase [Nitrososphaerales archaeon]